MNNDDTMRATWKQLRRTWRLLKWVFSAVLPVAAPHPENKRVLLVYDLASQPFSVGDILVLQEAALIVRQVRNLGKIDVAVVYDTQKPVVDDPAFSQIDRESFLFHLSSILPAAQVNPLLGAAFLFDSHESLESYIADNESRYFVWPTIGLYTSREYLFYHCFNELFFDYFQQYGRLPVMNSRPAAQTWARHFLEKHTPGQIAGTIQLRRNPVNPARNSRYDAWLAFFRHCESTYPVKFIAICAPHEIDPLLRNLPNVIIAKDHHTSLEQDLALIETAAFHMGASSGPSTICQFNDKPYCIFGWRIDPAVFKGITTDGHRHRFYFSTSFQNWIIEHETVDLLKSEFSFMWNEIRVRNREVS